MRWKLRVALEAAIGKAMRWKQSVARESHALEAERCVGSCKGKPCVGTRALCVSREAWSWSRLQSRGRCRSSCRSRRILHGSIRSLEGGVGREVQQDVRINQGCRFGEQHQGAGRPEEVCQAMDRAGGARLIVRSED